jgi:hypothetical protein
MPRMQASFYIHSQNNYPTLYHPTNTAITIMKCKKCSFITIPVHRKTKATCLTHPSCWNTAVCINLRSCLLFLTSVKYVNNSKNAGNTSWDNHYAFSHKVLALKRADFVVIWTLPSLLLFQTCFLRCLRLRYRIRSCCFRFLSGNLRILCTFGWTS